MSTNSHPRPLRLSAALTGAMAILLLVTAPASGANKGLAPDGRTYFAVITGVGDSPYEVQASCIQFHTTEMCVVDGDCFEYSLTEGGVQTRHQTSFQFAGTFLDDGLEVRIDGQGRADNRGRRSSLAAVAHAMVEDPVTGQRAGLNLSFSGREVGASRCQQLARDLMTALSALPD